MSLILLLNICPGEKKKQTAGKVQGATFYLLSQLPFNIPPTQIIFFQEFCAPVEGLKQCQGESFLQDFATACLCLK